MNVSLGSARAGQVIEMSRSSATRISGQIGAISLRWIAPVLQGAILGVGAIFGRPVRSTSEDGRPLVTLGREVVEDIVGRRAHRFQNRRRR